MYLHFHEVQSTSNSHYEFFFIMDYLDICSYISKKKDGWLAFFLSHGLSCSLSFFFAVVLFSNLLCKFQIFWDFLVIFLLLTSRFVLMERIHILIMLEAMFFQCQLGQVLFKSSISLLTWLQISLAPILLN